MEWDDEHMDVEFEAIRENVRSVVDNEAVHHVVRNFITSLFHMYAKNYRRLCRTADPSSSWNSKCVDRFLHYMLTAALAFRAWERRDGHNITRAQQRHKRARNEI